MTKDEKDEKQKKEKPLSLAGPDFKELMAAFLKVKPKDKKAGVKKKSNKNG